MVMSGRSVNLITLFLGRLRTPKQLTSTVKPVLVATSIKQATCIKQACVQFPKQANTLKCTCIKQAPVLSKQILIIP